MGKIKVPEPVKFFAGLISSDAGLMKRVEDLLEKKIGPVDFESGLFDFDLTDYYQDEMGQGLKRKFLCFKRALRAERGPDIKILTNKIEERFRIDKKRRINIDPGYLSLSNLILLTTKNFYHRIYLNKGIYAEVTLCFKEKTFRPLEWTYPDYKKPEYISFFNKAREDYLNTLRARYV